ncbi:MAG: tetratricopeptide repeat protein [Bacteroidia bacterium]|nr:tetratricopeptide repeat protein [Bacteroidia bacterium]
MAFLQEEPGDAFLKYAVAQEYLGMEKWAEARAWFERVLAEHPDYVATYYHLGRLLAMLGEVNNAVEILNLGLDVAEKEGDRKTKNEIAELLDGLE